MNGPNPVHEEDDDQGEVFLDESDIIHEVAVDEEDLPDVKMLMELMILFTYSLAIQVVNSLVSHSDSIECVRFAPSSPWVATGSMDEKLIIWDLQRSSARCTCDHEDGVTCLVWLGASRYVATRCVDGKVRIWDSLSGDCNKSFQRPCCCHSVSFHIC